MSFKFWLITLTLATGLCLGACSDDDTTPKPDTGVIIKDKGPAKDKTVQKDQAPVKKDGKSGCTKDTDCTSATAKKCNTATGKCVACLAKADCTTAAKPFCDTTTNKCAECGTDANCTGYVWGNKCLTSSTGKLCRCQKNADCSGNANGPTCYTKWSKCSCLKDSECTNKTYSKCSPPYATATYNNCQKPCTKKADCDTTLKCLTSGKCGACDKDADCSGTTKYCNVGLAKCVACKANTDCTAPQTCNVSTGQCVTCTKDADCAKDLDGGKCVAGACSCAADTDCKTGFAFGNTCLTSSTGTSSCRCKASTDCSANKNGPTCNTSYGTCTCSKDGDCKDTILKKCFSTPFSVTTSFKHCQNECKVDKDCTTSYAQYCKVATSQCRACTKNLHCAKNAWSKVCDTAKTDACVECTKNADCTADTLGNTCDATNGYICICKTDADCSANNLGRKCDTTAKACACTKDTECPTGKKCTESTSFGTKYCK